jgi:pimeloyl-ACP methyl ester carboxylesterase
VNDLFFDVRGLKLHAIERGAGETSLLLHGWLDHARSFDLLAPLLPGRTLSLDFRGHGDSAWVGPGGFYHFIDYLTDVDGILQMLPGPVRIVGHSMGAAVGLLYAAVRPECVKHLTLIDGAPLAIAPAEIPERLGSYLDDLRKFSRERRRVESVDDAVRRMQRFNPALSSRAARLLAEGGLRDLTWKWDPLLRAHSPLPVTEDLVRLIVANATTPVLAIKGESGFLQDEGDLRARFPALRIDYNSIGGAGHHVHLDAPEAVARLIAGAWAAEAAPSPAAPP